MKREGKTKSTRYVKHRHGLAVVRHSVDTDGHEDVVFESVPVPRRGKITIEDGKVVRTEEAIGEDSATKDTAATFDEIKRGRNNYQEELSKDFNFD